MTTAHQDHCRGILRVLDRLLQADGPVRHADLAAIAGYSPHHFARTFHSLVGEPPMELARRVRLERAAHRLRHTPLKVSWIAHEAGFDRLEPFIRAFRRTYGATPLEFRRGQGHISLIPCVSGLHWSPDGWVAPFLPVPRRTTMLQAKIIRFPATRVGTCRHIGETPGIDQSWAKLKPELAKRNLDHPHARVFTRFNDDPQEVGPANTRADLCFTVPDGFEPWEGIGESELPAGEYAVFLHQGEDDLIVDTWARAFSEWLPQSGRDFNGVCFEEYVNGFYLRSAQPGEKLVVTAVYIGLKPSS